MSARSVRSKNKTLQKFISNTSALRAPVPQFTDPLRREKIQAMFPAVRESFREFCETQNIPGLAFGIVIDGELAFADAMGWRNVEQRAPVALDTVFRIASMSKSFIAMAILKLRDAQKLRLDDAAAQYLPELKTLAYPTRDAAPITLRDLLTMVPGFPEDNPWGDRQMAIGESVFTRWLRAGIPFSNAPNLTFEYSNYAYAMLGRIVTRVSGMSFQDYVTKNILQPLQMRATTWDKTRVRASRLAQGYRFEDETWKPEPILPDGAFAGMAGLFTTIPDFARYMAFLLGAFPPRDERTRGPVSRATAREMQQLMRFEELVTRTLEGDKEWHAVSGYGYGLAIWQDERFGYGVSHGGGLPGYGSYYYLLPEHGVGVVAFTNKTYGRVGMVFPKIFHVLAQGGGLSPRASQPAPILVKMRDMVQHWLESGDDAQVAAQAADNFYLDSDAAHRRAELDKLRADLGAFQHVGALRAHNALRGTWRIECERGALEVFLTLAPTMPPRIQMCRLTPIQTEAAH
jgi:CubicO group peptidase (beta-lactamase class C family)